VSKKNYVVANAVDNIIRAPPAPKNTEKAYLSKPDYGKVPIYLSKVKKEIADEYEYIKKVDSQNLIFFLFSFNRMTVANPVLVP
jgi:hypothetical protein